MTQEVLLTISGLHELGGLEIQTEEDQVLETITPAKYYLKNGKHYILYEEVVEGMTGIIKNKVKLTEGKVLEIIKTGQTNAHMIFEKDKNNLTIYDTPYGQFFFDMYTRELEVLEQEEEISIKVEYTMSMNNQKVADCKVFMNIRPKTANIL